MIKQSAHFVSASLALSGASEFALSIALAVFIMITLMLAAILALLYVSKSFRAFFFREEIKRQRAALKRKQEQAEKQRTLPDAALPQIEQPPPVEQAAPSTATSEEQPQRKPRTRKRASGYSDGVLTVPLTFQAAEKPRSTKKRGNSFDGITTVELPPVTSDPVTFTPRSITVARAKKGTTAEPIEANEKSGTKRRASKPKNIRSQ